MQNNSSYRTVATNSLFKIKLYQVRNIRNVDPIAKIRKGMQIHLKDADHVNTLVIKN